MNNNNNNSIDNSLSSNGIAEYKLKDSYLREEITTKIVSVLGKENGINLKSLDQFHKFIKKDELNTIRLKLASSLNEKSFAADLIFSKVKDSMINLLGPDIAIQKNVGLSIQLPGDDSSLLNVHSDVLDSDCSPYEIVIRVPLVDCFDTKSMFYLPFSHTSDIKEYIKLSDNIRKNLKDPKVISKYIEYIKISPPSILFFSHSIWHGNTINLTNETRFSINLRVKNIFTPYRGKKLGDFFKIASLSKLSKLASKIEVLINE